MERSPVSIELITDAIPMFCATCKELCHLKGKSTGNVICCRLTSRKVGASLKTQNILTGDATLTLKVFHRVEISENFETNWIMLYKKVSPKNLRAEKGKGGSFGSYENCYVTLKHQEN